MRSSNSDETAAINRFQATALLGLGVVCACAAVVAFALLRSPGQGGQRPEGPLRPGATAPPEPERPVYSLRGVVRGDNPGGVTLTIQGPVFDMAMSADDGSFSFDGLEAGSYRVTAARAGARFKADFAEVEVPSQAAVSVSFELTTPPPQPVGRKRTEAPAAWWGYWLYSRLPTSFYAYPYPAPPPPAPMPFPTAGDSGGARGAPPRESGISDRTRETVRELLVAALSDGDARVRAEAALALGRLGDKSRPAADALVAALKDEKVEVRSCAVLALGMLRLPEYAPILLGIATDAKAQQAERIHAAVAAGLSGGEPQAIGLMNIASGNNNDILRAAALAGLAATDSNNETITTLSALLSNNSKELQAAAASCVGGRAQRVFSTGSGRRARSLDLCEVLCKRLLNRETAALVRGALSVSVAQFPVTGADLKAILEALRAEQDPGALANCAVAAGIAAGKLEDGAPERASALEALKRCHAEQKDATARACAVFGAGLSRAPGAGEHLLDVFMSNEDPDARAAAAVGLGMIGHRPAVPQLISEVMRPRSAGDARGMSMLALGMIGDEAGLVFLRTVLAEARVPYFRWWAAAGLGQARDGRSFAVLAGQASDRNRITRDGALRAIARFGDDEAAAVLEAGFRSEGVAEIRALILHLLGECARGPDRRLGRIAAAFPPDLLFSLGETGMLLYLRR